MEDIIQEVVIMKEVEGDREMEEIIIKTEYLEVEGDMVVLREETESVLFSIIFKSISHFSKDRSLAAM